MQPYVILHMGISLDGRIDWGGGSDNPYYELVDQFGADVDISGSNTILQATFPENPRHVERIRDCYVWLRYKIEKRQNQGGLPNKARII